MSREDKFLRNYILGENWKDSNNIDSKNSKSMEVYNEIVDGEDEQRDLEMDLYEHKYNFRFEEPQGQYIQTHAREVEDTMRKKESKRIKERGNKK